MIRNKTYKISAVLLLFLSSIMLGLASEPCQARACLKAPELTKENVLAYMIEIEVREPLKAFQLCMYETGHLKSRLARKHFNLFGMKKPGKWQSKHSRVLKYRNLHYSDWRHSIDDFKTYQDKYIKGSFASHFSNSNYSAYRNYYKRFCQVRINTDLMEFAINEMNKKLDNDYTKNSYNYRNPVPYSWGYYRLVA